MSSIFEVESQDHEDTSLRVGVTKDNCVGIFIHKNGVGYTSKIISLSQAAQLRDWLTEQLYGK